jgi:EpsI family protein
MNLWLKNLIFLVLMLAASGFAMVLRPSHKITDQGAKVDLEILIPRTFGDWREEKQPSAQIIDPQQKEMIDKIYSQTLTRTYVNSINGYKIMLSIAYRDDQRDSLKMHYPEVCYPAQGFEVISNRSDVLSLEQRSIPVRRLETQLGQQRHEPVTYWAVIGEIPIRGGTDKKLAEMRYGMIGQIPDGLLFRISSIDPETDQAFEYHERFALALLHAVKLDWRSRFFGKTRQ